MDDTDSKCSSEGPNVQNTEYEGQPEGNLSSAIDNLTLSASNSPPRELVHMFQDELVKDLLSTDEEAGEEPDTDDDQEANQSAICGALARSFVLRYWKQLLKRDYVTNTAKQETFDRMLVQSWLGTGKRTRRVEEKVVYEEERKEIRVTLERFSAQKDGRRLVSKTIEKVLFPKLVRLL
jgi:hypothetical protein